MRIIACSRRRERPSLAGQDTVNKAFLAIVPYLQLVVAIAGWYSGALSA
jgi:hypothetical protein